jgi:putative ABC transport system permease protein
MKYSKFIWGNLWRKPVRTIFTLLSIVFGFVLFGLVLGFDANLRHIAESANPERVYTSPRFGGKLVLAQMQQILQLHHVSHVGAIGAVPGYFQQSRNRVIVLMQGPGLRDVFHDLPLTPSDWGALATTRNGVFVSHLYSVKYGLKTGSSFPVISPNLLRSDGSDVWGFTVLGVIPDIPLLPVGFAIGNYSYLDESRPEADRSEVQQLWVLAQDAVHTDDVTREIDQWFSNSGSPTRSVSEKAMLAGAGGGGSDALNALIALALSGMVMITFLTGNALRHSIRERTTEIAVLKTLGFSNLKISTLILTEVALPCLFGCFFGLAFAAQLAALAPLILPATVSLPTPRIDLEVVLAGVVAALLIAFTAGALPVMRIAKFDVAAALSRQ